MRKLTESEAKQLLARYQIPVTSPVIVASPEAAVEAAKSFGAKVALKISSRDITHKSSCGCVRLGVTKEDAAEAYEAIMEAAAMVDGAQIDGVLVEPMAARGLEIILGATRDREFGPAVMLGLGGVDVEARRCVEFRLAPLTQADAADLVASLPVSNLLTERARDTVIEVVLAVAGSKGIVFQEPLADLDINPLIVSADSVQAVDAHVVLTSDDTGPTDVSGLSEVLKPDLCRSLGAIFEPSGIVVVGASTRPDKLGFIIIRNLVDYGFRGPLYAVHPTANNIYGCQCFSRVEDVPTEVDRAIIAVAASEVPRVLRACAGQGVRVAQVYSAGFAEWSDEGKEFETRIREVVSETGLRVIGPNTIGTFSASGRLTLTVPRYSPNQPGPISFVGQSGTYVLDIISRSQVIGLPLGKSLSCGNCVDLDPVDYLAFLAEDPDTTIIGMYLEEVREAGSFFRLASCVNKPIVLMKGGRTDAGSRAANSHTGALASNMALWSASCRQAGVIAVESIEAMLDVFLVLAAFGGRPYGHDIALFTSGGGISVGAADTAAEAGLNMICLEERTGEALARFGVPGTSVKNPIDIPVWGLKTGGRFIFNEMIDTLANDSKVCAVMACVEMGSVFSFSADEKSGLDQMELICESIMSVKTSKPISVVFRTTGDKIQDDFLRAMRPRMLERGIAVFPTIERSIISYAAAMASMSNWKGIPENL